MDPPPPPLTPSPAGIVVLHPFLPFKSACLPGCFPWVVSCTSDRELCLRWCCHMSCGMFLGDNLLYVVLLLSMNRKHVSHLHTHICAASTYVSFCICACMCMWVYCRHVHGMCMHATFWTFREHTSDITELQSPASGMLRKEKSFPKLPEEGQSVPCTHQAKSATFNFLLICLMITVHLQMLCCWQHW